ncbi:MAG: histidine phosphatase family protein [Peptostreptococcaceae bacterium]
MLVTDAIVIKAIYAIVKGYKIEEFWKTPFIKNVCVTIIECNKKNYKIILEADTSHASS